MSVAGTLAIYAGSNVTQLSGTVTANQLYINSGGTFTMNGGTLNVGTANVFTAAAFVVGNGSSAATLNLMGGGDFAQGLSVSAMATLTASGGVSTSPFGTVPLTVSGTIAPASAIQVNGALVLTPSATTLIQSVGATPYFAPIEANSMTLAGQLVVYENAANEAITTSGQTFIILQTDGGGFNGAFANIASGQTLTTANGSATFLVTITGGNYGYVELSGFQAVPEPGSAGAVACGVASLLLRRRRRC